MKHLAFQRRLREQSASKLVFSIELEKRLEVTFPETIVALALDELEKDRADDGFREDLEQNSRLAAVHDALAVDQDAVLLQPLDWFLMPGIQASLGLDCNLAPSETCYLEVLPSDLLLFDRDTGARL